MFAVVEIAGHQYKLSKGDVVDVDKLKGHKEGDKIKFDKVLLRSDGKKTDIGTPYVSGASIEILLQENLRGDKIRVFKKKPKKRYERTYGHRQWYSRIEVMAVK